MTSQHEGILLEVIGKLTVYFGIAILCLMGILGIYMLLHYEGYYCTPVEQSGNTVTINAWCGHNGVLIEKNGKQFWQVNGTNFGDGFP